MDVGANRGVYSYVALSAGFRVVACEPNPALAEYIRGWARTRVDVRQVVASASSGEVVIAIPIDGRGRELDGLASAEVSRIRAQSQDIRELRVPSTSVDDMAIENVSFVKIDVEGHEQEVLAGASRTLEVQRPFLQLEIEERHRPGSVAACCRILSALGYSGHFVHDGQLEPAERLVPEIHQNPINVGVRHAYVNNFYFTATPDQLAWLSNAVADDSPE